MKVLATAPALPDGRERPCHAALFLTYTFDPAFFEETVLPSIVPVAADPDGEPTRFLSEATAALARIPVVVVADSGVANRSRRLPYDLLLIARRTFHPKLTVLVYEDALSVRIASGNLTRLGYGGNAELFTEIEIRPDEPSHIAALHDLRDILSAVGEDLPAVTPQWKEVWDAVVAQIDRISVDADTPSVRLLHPTKERSLLDHLWEYIPDDAKVERVGVVAPFFELDCVDAGADVDGFLSELSRRSESSTGFDLVCPWDRQQPLPDNPRDVANHTPGWWEEECDEEEAGSKWNYFATTEENTSSGYVVTRNRSGKRDPYPVADLQAWSDEYEINAMPRPVVHIPAGGLARLANRHDVALWLHPSSRYDGRKVHRQPLHAKVLALTFCRRGRRATVLAIGSANASRKAWTMTLDEGGNCEAVAVFCREGVMGIGEIDPWAVHCPIDLVAAQERDYPERPFDSAGCVVSAVFDPGEKRLSVVWAIDPPVAPWSLSYADTVLAHGPRIPSTPTIVDGMEYRPGVLVLTIDLNGERGEVPIQVTAPIDLPMPGSGIGYALEDLIRLMGHAVGRSALEERYSAIESVAHSGAQIDDGQPLRPTEIFKAWWALAADLAVPGITPRATAVLIDGPTGAKRTWRALLERVKRGGMDRYDAWFFGAELVRELDNIDLRDAVRAGERRQAIDTFGEDVRRDMASLGIGQDYGWAKHLATFYAQEVSS